MRSPTRTTLFSITRSSISLYLAFITLLISINMEKDFNYQSVPGGFAHCFNHKCSNSKICLRALAAKECESGKYFINTVNPAFYPEEEDSCPYLIKNEKVRIAWGITHLFDSVPYKKASELRRRLISHFNKSHYYRIYRKELPLTPSDQQYINLLFKQEGIKEAPSFDSYSETYNW